MLDLFINTGVFILIMAWGFYGGYKLGHMNGRIKQMEMDDKELDEMIKNA